jgi:hypothetical protein
MIFVTPHIVTDLASAQAMTAKWEGATGLYGTNTSAEAGEAN